MERMILRKESWISGDWWVPGDVGVEEREQLRFSKCPAAHLENEGSTTLGHQGHWLRGSKLGPWEEVGSSYTIHQWLFWSRTQGPLSCARALSTIPARFQAWMEEESLPWDRMMALDWMILSRPFITHKYPGSRSDEFLWQQSPAPLWDSAFVQEAVF